MVQYNISYSQTGTTDKNDKPQKIYIGTFFNKGNKNYNNDRFNAYSIHTNILRDYFGYSLEAGFLHNTEEGRDYCYGEMPEEYSVSYNTLYFYPKVKIFFKNFGLDVGLVALKQDRGWCENIEKNWGIFTGEIKLGNLNKIYLSVGNADNFMLARNSDLLKFGIGYTIKKYDSDFWIGKSGKGSLWGYEIKYRIKINDHFYLKGAGSYHDNLQARKLEQHKEVYSFRIGLDYYLSKFK